MKYYINNSRDFMVISILILSLVISLVRCGGTSGGDDSEPLSFFEEQLVGKWSRYHGYDDSYNYYIFYSDRMGCKFDITSTGSRENEYTYYWWGLDEENPVGNNVFEIIVRTSQGGEGYSTAEYHYNEDEVWMGGYDNLVMTRSSTSRECSCKE